MTITPVTDFVLQLRTPASDAAADSTPRRSTGLHVSSILRAIAIKLGKLHVDDDAVEGEYDGLPVDALLRVALGLAWEDWLGPRLAPTGSLYHFAELHHDGIFLSPDGVAAVTLCDRGYEELRVDEIKLTWTTCNRAPQDRWMWVKQTACYCHVLAETTGIPCTRARWYPYYVNGDYGKFDGRRGPKFEPLDIEFTADELEATWRLVTKYAHLGHVEYAQ